MYAAVQRGIASFWDSTLRRELTLFPHFERCLFKESNALPRCSPFLLNVKIRLLRWQRRMPEQDRQFSHTYNATLRRVRATIVAV